MQSNQLAGKKRPAPGAAPITTQYQPTASTTTQMAGANNDNSDLSALTNDQFLAWGSNADGSLQQPDYGGYGGMMIPQDQNAAQMSNQLVRRNQNNQLAPSAQAFDGLDPGEWPGSGRGAPWMGDNGMLSEKAEKARREAVSKRPPKSIPPFIQKLSSFLDNNSNGELIRWSSTGDSFIVLDEEQFANKLIPELFKHNNYASFVRQLNMYGFHKKVGLTDNSMRASERKAKSPSEYENEFFKRGRPELLWLITKPRSTKKKKGQDDASDDDDAQDEQIDHVGGGGKKMDLVTLPRSQLATFQSEIQQMQRQQQHINNMIARFQHENTQYIRQATERHERHENSINAILQFLATFYSRNADPSGNIPNMFGGNLPNNQPSGNVQEMNDYDDGDEQSASHNKRPPSRRPLALLPAPAESPKVRSVSPEAASSRPASSQEPQQPTLHPPSHNATAVNKSSTPQAHSALRNTMDNTPTPQPHAESTPEITSPGAAAANAVPPRRPQTQATAQQSQSSQPQQPQKPPLQSSNSEIMRLINNSNAASPNMNNLDFSSALKNYENASPNGPLTPEQRNNVLSSLMASSGASSPMSNALLATSGAQDYMQQFANNQDQLDLLHRLQQEQDSRVQNLAGRLQPLSPHGSIPGLNGTNGQSIDTFNLNGTDGSPTDGFDINNFLNTDYGDDGTANSAFNFDGQDPFSFDDSQNNYFGNVSTEGLNNQTTSGAEDGKGADMFNTTGQEEQLFGGGDGGEDGGVDSGANESGLLFPEGHQPTAGKEGDSEGGKVIGSVSTGSAGRSPALEAVEDEESGGRRKRQKRG